MDKALSIVKLLLYLAAIAALAACAWWLVQLRTTTLVTQRNETKLYNDIHDAILDLSAPCPVVHPAGEPCGGIIVQLTNTVDTLNTSVSGVNNLLRASTQTVKALNKTVDLVNKPCPDDALDKLHPCGTLADINKALNTARGTMGQIEIAANHEDKNLTTLDKQEATLFGDLHSTLGSTNTAVQTFNTILSDKNVPLILANVQGMTLTGNHMLFTADAVETKLTKCTLHSTFSCAFKSDAIFGAQVGGYILSAVH